MIAVRHHGVKTLDGKVRCQTCLRDLGANEEGSVYELLGELVTRLPAGTEILPCAHLRRQLPTRRRR